MKKIMFNERYGLTDAVLSGRKTQTRRIIPASLLSGTIDIDGNNISVMDKNGDWHDIREAIRCFKVGEIVAVAQSYKDANIDFVPIAEGVLAGDKRKSRKWGWAKNMSGWNNKMFTTADVLPHQIRITNVRIERLQDISDEDCIAEGVEKVAECKNFFRIPIFHKSGSITYLSGESPREAYAALINKISGKGTWESNPYVFAYDFELVKCLKLSQKEYLRFAAANEDKIENVPL